MCSAEDDYGTSYYYRGNVTNNYVSFAGFIWRIVRINGDGSIRLIYDGTSAHVNGEASDDRQITTSAYNNYYTGNAYVGYMYGENIWGEPSASETTSVRTLNDMYYYYSSSYTFDTTTGKYTLVSPTQNVWNSNLVGYYTCESSTLTSCDTLLYIESYYDYYRGNVYTYTSISTDGVYSESHETNVSLRTLATEYSYGTGYTFNSSSGTFSLTNSSTGVYGNNKIGMYTCESGMNDECTIIYRIDSEETETSANVTTISRTGTTYEETHANIKDSTIKTVIDNWYKTNIVDAGYASYVSDTLFCNDRSFHSSNSGTGTGSSDAYYRWYTFNVSEITLKCNQKNDRFTVNDTKIGNRALNYPVALITTDEVVLGGGHYGPNSSYYLYTGRYYWTMSPYYYKSSKANVRTVFSSGYMNASDQVNHSYGVRPVINLKAGTLSSGSGTATDPYLLSLT